MDTWDDPMEIECLACGHHRLVAAGQHEQFGECPYCRYVGWAEPSSLTEQERTSMHRELAATFRAGR